jgi:betaine-aldehyde dehydrogenase
MTSTDNAPAPADEREDARPIDPATLEPLGHLPATTPEELDESAQAAAARGRTRWSRDGRWRADVLRAWADALRAHGESLAAALVAETGKPVTEARAEVAGAVEALTYNAGLARHVGGTAGTLSDGSVAHLIREPVGLSAFIVPWNWPVLLLFRDLAPALAAGVTALVKPALQTSLVTERVIALGRDAGLPADAVRLVIGDVAVGRAVIAHPALRAVAFTGSTAVGTEIMRDAAHGMKRTLLELGGKGAAVVFADADVSRAVDALLPAVVITAGQMCMACTRILVQRPLLEEVRERLLDGLRALRIGDPRDERTKVGPLISAGQRARVERYLTGAGGTVLGGERVRPDGLPGHFLAPALVTDVDVHSPIVQEDIFGPVVTLETFESEVEAIRLANATPYGLASAVWTADVDRAWRMSRAIEAGTVWVNGYNRSYPEMPSGGYKSSGVGRTRGVAGLELFTELKHVHFSVTEPAFEEDR